LTIGGVDSSKFSGSLTYVIVITADPLYAKNWAIDVSSVTAGSTVLLNASHPVIVDTGTTFTYLPESAYDAFLDLTGGVNDPTTGVTYWTSPPTVTLTFTISGTNFKLAPSQYIIPAAQLDALGQLLPLHLILLSDC
jgi:hypothetical protein